VSSQRARTGGGPIWIILAVVFPAMIASAAALSYYGYQYADDVSRRMEDAFRETAASDAKRIVESIESRIDSLTRQALESVVLATREADSCDADLSPFVATYAVMRFTSSGVLRVTCSQGNVNSLWRAAAGSSAAGVYPKSLDFSSVQIGNFRYLHQRFEQEDTLIAYMRKQSDDGRSFFVGVQIDSNVLHTMISEEVRQNEGRRRIVVLDQRRRALVGQTPDSIAGDTIERFSYQVTLGKMLYAWDLFITPWDLDALVAQEKKQRTLGPALVVLSSAIIAVGLVIVWLGVLAERRMSRLRSDFIANVSHELKTPLSLIRMFAELIATGRHKDQNAVGEYGAIITRESERLSHLIDNVLDFSRLERGKASYHFTNSDVGEILLRAVDLCRQRVEKEKVNLQVQIEPNLPHVRLDEGAFTLAFLNLIDNALKYGGTDGRIDVELRRTPGQVCLRVRDHGPGIAPEDRGRIFERFFRGKNAREGNVRGSGIGLSLVEHIAASHGGRITVEDPASSAGEPGQGTVFCIYLPAPVAGDSISTAKETSST
jgi:two-component system, OmpR family, phosphate regulon sensor histidine kinase PhoR